MNSKEDNDCNKCNKEFSPLQLNTCKISSLYELLSFIAHYTVPLPTNTDSEFSPTIFCRCGYTTCMACDSAALGAKSHQKSSRLCKDGDFYMEETFLGPQYRPGPNLIWIETCWLFPILNTLYINKQSKSIIHEGHCFLASSGHLPSKGSNAYLPYFQKKIF